MADRPSLRSLPSVDALLRQLADAPLPRPAIVAIVRRELAAVRAEASAGSATAPDAETILTRVRAAIDALASRRLRPVINATGVIVHTNLGRAPLSTAAADAIAAVATQYNTLEFDLVTGQRGGRSAYIEHNLAVLCQAEAATVVNNCAAALVLILKALAVAAPRTHVIISRGELVQIGGGFRVPEILEASGAILHEVGTTNQTTADDYRRAIDDRTAMILKVHRSNFYMGGFVASPTTEQLAAVAREAGVPLVEDLGSGVTFDTAPLPPGIAEPTPADCLRAGVDLVCFSGDKLLGGPQAGIIAGNAALIAALKRDPFFRALRIDKLISAALEVTVDQLLREVTGAVPVRAMIEESIETLHGRAERIIDAVAEGPVRFAIGHGVSRIGGGAMPQTELPSVTIDLTAAALGPDALMRLLREADLPVIGYVADDRVKLDLRTVLPHQNQSLIAALNALAHQLLIKTALK
ncbi:MAG: L-seryl-tRNA(Sec) selenium transferase [Phycisphaerales bacterium]|nr:L-seryl-tRNA(Sec) selenium transferase [Phycisphaerales bacterium]